MKKGVGLSQQQYAFISYVFLSPYTPPISFLRVIINLFITNFVKLLGAPPLMLTSHYVHAVGGHTNLGLPERDQKGRYGGEI